MRLTSSRPKPWASHSSTEPDAGLKPELSFHDVTAFKRHILPALLSVAWHSREIRQPDMVQASNPSTGEQEQEDR